MYILFSKSINKSEFKIVCMKISIDTKEDSKEEIRKVISMLSALVDQPQHSNIFDDSSPPETGSLMGMFDAEPSTGDSDDSEDTEPEDKPPISIVPY